MYEAKPNLLGLPQATIRATSFRPITPLYYASLDPSHLDISLTNLLKVSTLLTLLTTNY